jgi:Protein of unknown function (DUF3301)
MWEAGAIIAIAAGVLFWIDSLRARERAVQSGRSACQRYDVQFLDETVSFTKLRVARDNDGRLRLARTYTFEFTETGNNRRHGAIVMLGHDLQDIQMEPYRVQ